jgi:putative PIN family toxin of toxin-antitoxin system
MASEAERVVFDCVVYAQAIINPFGPAGRCLEMTREGTLSLCISEYLIAEIRALPPKLASRVRITPEKMDEFIMDLVICSRRVDRIDPVFRLDRDRSDSHYVNLAVAASASFLVTRDKDLLSLMTHDTPNAVEFRHRFPGVGVIDPVALLDRVKQTNESKES